MAATFQQAADDLREIGKRFHGLLALAEHLAKLGSVDGLEANVRRLQSESASIMENMRRQATADVERNTKAAVQAAEAKAKALLDDAERQRAEILKTANDQAAAIVADARSRAEELDAKFKTAQAHVQKALG
jgi:cell division septum initiation protein DivIVA